MGWCVEHGWSQEDLKLFAMEDNRELNPSEDGLADGNSRKEEAVQLTGCGVEDTNAKVRSGIHTDIHTVD